MKKLLIFPLAAWLCGAAVSAPRLKPRLPEFPFGSCEAMTRKNFLLAYAYQKEMPTYSDRLAQRALALLTHCENEPLRERIRRFINSLPAKENARRLRP